MSAWHPSSDYKRVAEANRQFYAATAQQYDATETCVNSAAMQHDLECALERALALFRKPLCAVRGLDACGGSGNVAMKLLRRGVSVTHVDISPELQDIFRARATAAGFEPRTVNAEVADYLARTSDEFDLVVFSSALHHLEDIDGVLALTWQRLTPGGLVLTIFDPTRRADTARTTRALLRLEYYAWKMVRQAPDLLPALRRRWRRMREHWGSHNKRDVPITSATAGLLAEYHVDQGIDDVALVARMVALGFEVVAHERVAECRFRPLSRVVAALGDVTAFRLLLRKPATRVSARGPDAPAEPSLPAASAADASTSRG